MTKAELRAACVSIAPDFTCTLYDDIRHGVLWVGTYTERGKRMELSMVRSSNPRIDVEHMVLQGCLDSLRRRSAARNVHRTEP